MSCEHRKHAAHKEVVVIPKLETEEKLNSENTTHTGIDDE